MINKGVLKRILPFFATFAFGLLVASLFVSVAPNFRLSRGGSHRDFDRQIRCENFRLRQENYRLRQQTGDTAQPNAEFSGDLNELVPPPPPLPPVAAPRPVR